MPAGSLTVYCIDTSILIDFHRHYPRDIFGVWDNLEVLIAEDRAIAPKQVRDELKAWDDWLAKWAAKQKTMFKPLLAKHAKCASEIIAHSPALAHAERRTESADPFVIGLALAEKRTSLLGSDYVVVTSESRTKGGRIPNACGHFGVGCLSLFEFMKAEGWSFVQGPHPTTQ